jgi:hypothetical protein
LKSERDFGLVRDGSIPEAKRRHCQADEEGFKAREQRRGKEKRIRKEEKKGREQR